MKNNNQMTAMDSIKLVAKAAAGITATTVGAAAGTVTVIGVTLANHIDTNKGGILDTATNKTLSESFTNGRQLAVDKLVEIFDSLATSQKQANKSNTYSPYV